MLVAKAFLLLLMAAACGFLLFFPFSSSSHIHFQELTGLQGHRVAAFCAFTRSCSSEDNAMHQSTAHEGASNRTPPPQSVRHIVLQERPHEEKVEKEITQGVKASKAGPASSSAVPPLSIPGSTVQEARIALSTRACRSPAIDGYTKIDAACMKQSPTNQWFQAYYRAGGKQADLVVHYDQAASYDGIAVAWGLTNKKDTVEECAAHCLRHMPGDIPGPFQQMPCNVFVYCPLEECWEPDAWHATKGDCWLKFSEAPAKPEVNVRGDLSRAVKERHPEAPRACSGYQVSCYPQELS